MTLSANVCQLQHPLPALFAPVKAAVTPPAEQNKPLPGKDVEAAAANAVASFQATPVKAAEGTESDTQYYTLNSNGRFCLENNLTYIHF